MPQESVVPIWATEVWAKIVPQRWDVKQNV